ncbi:hypothetical protein BH09PSE6_BH09PSE6_08290 [soil metagenome]
MESAKPIEADGSRVGDDHAGLMISALAVFAGVNLWWNFAGPFRWLAGLELERFGRYSEPITGWIVVVGFYFAAWFVELAVRRLLRGRGGVGSGGAIGLSVSAAGFSLMATVLLFQAWQRVDRHLQLPANEGPRRVVDIGRAGPDSLPEGPVRVIGVPDRARLATIHTRPGSRKNAGWWDEYAPVVAHAASRAETPIRLLVNVKRSDYGDPGPGITDDLQGRLVNDALQGRELYRLRERGLDVDEHTSMLYSPGGLSVDFKTELAVLTIGALALLVLAQWAARSAVSEWSARASAPGPVEPTTSARSTPVLHSMRFRFGAGLSLLGLGIVGVLHLLAWLIVIAPLLVVGPVLFGLVWTSFVKKRSDRKS